MISDDAANQPNPAERAHEYSYIEPQVSTSQQVESKKILGEGGRSKGEDSHCDLPAGRRLQ